MAKPYSSRYINYNIVLNHEEFFETKEEAFESVDFYKNNDSGINRFVSIFDAFQDKVLRMLVHKDGILMDDFVDGDMVRFRKEYRELKDARTFYAVSNLDDSSGLCLITPLNRKDEHPSPYMVSVDKIEWIAPIEKIGIYIKEYA